MSLYPFWFLEMDGYHILTDLLGMPSLKEDSFHLVREGLWRGGPFGRAELIQLGYFVLSLVSIVGVHRPERVADRGVPVSTVRLARRREPCRSASRHSTPAISTRQTGPLRNIAPSKRTKAGMSPATSQ